MTKYFVTLYDLVGYIVPGFLFTASVIFYLDISYCRYNLIELFSRFNIIIMLLVFYILGHVVQSLSYYVTFLFEKDEIVVDLSENQKNMIRGVYKKILPSWGEVRSIDNMDLKLMEMVINNENTSNIISVSKANYGLFRALMTVFLINIIVSALFLAFNTNFCELKVSNYSFEITTKFLLIIFLISIFLGIVCNRRYKRFNNKVQKDIVYSFMAMDKGSKDG